MHLYVMMHYICSVPTLNLRKLRIAQCKLGIIPGLARINKVIPSLRTHFDSEI